MFVGSSNIIISESIASIDAIVSFLSSSGAKLIGLSFLFKLNLSHSLLTISLILFVGILSCFGPNAISSLTLVASI